jgi:hypothetical protein
MFFARSSKFCLWFAWPLQRVQKGCPVLLQKGAIWLHAVASRSDAPTLKSIEADPKEL